MAENPHLEAFELVERLREEGYAASRTLAYKLVRLLRADVGAHVLPGEIAQHALVDVTVDLASGARRTLSLFVSRLVWSGATLVEWVEPGIESPIRAMARHYAELGGRPKIASLDDPGLLAERCSQREGVTYKPVFASAMQDLDIRVVSATTDRAFAFPSLVSAVGLVLDGISPLPTVHELKRAVEARFAEDRLAQESRWALERQSLRAIAVAPERFALRYPMIVDASDRVRHEGFTYAAPGGTTGASGTVLVYPDEVRVVVGDRSASNPRGVDVGTRPASVADAYALRTRLLQLGEPVASAVSRISRSAPLALPALAGLHRLHTVHGREALVSALEDLLTSLHEVDEMRHGDLAAGR